MDVAWELLQDAHAWGQRDGTGVVPFLQAPLMNQYDSSKLNKVIRLVPATRGRVIDGRDSFICSTTWLLQLWPRTCVRSQNATPFSPCLLPSSLDAFAALHWQPESAMSYSTAGKSGNHVLPRRAYLIRKIYRNARKVCHPFRVTMDGDWVGSEIGVEQCCHRKFRILRTAPNLDCILHKQHKG